MQVPSDAVPEQSVEPSSARPEPIETVEKRKRKKRRSEPLVREEEDVAADKTVGFEADVVCCTYLPPYMELTVDSAEPRR